MVVATVKRSARDASTAVPIGPLTRRALEGFRRTDAADAPPRRGQAPRPHRRRVRHRPRHLPPPAPHRPRPRAPEDRRARRGLVDGAIVALLFHGALRRSEVAALCWADVDFRDGDDVVVTVRRSKSDSPSRQAAAQAAANRRLIWSSSATRGRRSVARRTRTCEARKRQAETGSRRAGRIRITGRVCS